MLSGTGANCVCCIITAMNVKEHFWVVTEMLHPTDNAGENLDEDELPAQVKKSKKMQKKPPSQRPL